MLLIKYDAKLQKFPRFSMENSQDFQQKNTKIFNRYIFLLFLRGVNKDFLLNSLFFYTKITQRMKQNSYIKQTLF